MSTLRIFVYSLIILIIIFVICNLIACSTLESKTSEYQNGELVKQSKILDTGNNFYGKAVHAGTDVYGIEAAAANSTTYTPAFRLGIINTNFHTLPMKKGQECKITHKTTSIWNSKASTETVIWIGKAESDMRLNVTDINGEINVDTQKLTE